MMLMDKRQRAMLKEMGVRVWQPLPEVVPASPAPTATPSGAVKKPDAAINSVAARPRIYSPVASFNTQKQPTQTPQAPAQDANTTPAWRVGTTHTLYADAAQTAPRWLVLLEAPASALLDAFDPLGGDAGKLLDNMLRAARLHTAGAVLLAPLVRAGTAGASGELPAALAALLANAKADVVLVMGRLAAQALLQSTEPFAKLRGQVHAVQGQSVVITIDPTYLLRHPQDKAKAWDDLCLALSIASAG